MVRLSINILFGLFFAIIATASSAKLSEKTQRYCGNDNTNLNRDKRYVLLHAGHKSKTISYRIQDYSKNLTHEQVDDVIQRAFNIWTEHTDLKFVKKQPDEAADISIRFVVGAHGCAEAFDGRGGILAHAHLSYAHFDDDEDWKATSDEHGTSLFKIAVHELGHSLGLFHTDEAAAIMFWAHCDDNEEQFKLHDDDIRGIQALYGEKVVKPVFNLDLCKDPTIDTMFNTPDGKTYVFKKDKYYEIDGTVIAEGPKPITDKWKGLPESLDAAFTQNGKTFFFKGSEYWRFNNYKMDDGYPGRLDRYYSEIPDGIDDATVWKDGKVYFFRGSKVYRMDEFSEEYTTVDEKYIVNEWKGIPNRTDAVHYSETYGSTFFFKVENFYVYESSANAPVPHSTPTTSYFFSCRNFKS